MKFTIHIGAGKTGSSSIQRALKQSAKLLLEHGTFVPPASLETQGPTPGYHVFAFQDLLHREPSDAASDFEAKVASLVETARQRNATQILLSAENLSNLNPWIDILGKGLAPHDLELVMYVRRQDLYFLSAWQQWGLKLGKGFDDWYQANKVLQGQWQQVIEMWEAFQPTRFVVRPYDRSQLVDGDVVADFFEQIGASAHRVKTTEAEANHSYSIAAEELALSSPNLFDDAHDNRFFARLDEYALGGQKKQSRESRIDFAQRIAILEDFADCNRWVAEKYLNGAQLFEPPIASDFDYIDDAGRADRRSGLLAELFFGMSEQQLRNNSTETPKGNNKDQ